MNENLERATKNSVGKYLFCYFTGNEPEKETINYAVSEDGYNFKPLNNNKPFLFNEKGTKGVRDPFVFRAQDGSFYIVGTDMRSENGWCSNHALCVWRSDDLINFQQYELIDMNDYGLQGSVRSWAPEVIYDKEKEMYMIYWANCQHNEETDEWTKTVMWYAYTKDFTKLETKPQILYAPPCNKDAIDADIIEHDGIYYMYYKDENEKCICYVYSKKPNGPYIEPENKNITVFNEPSEGCCMYKIEGTDIWVMIMDLYTSGRYAMQQTRDFVNFKAVCEDDYSLSFSPRHGSMLSITDEEYERIVSHFAESK